MVRSAFGDVGVSEVGQSGGGHRPVRDVPICTGFAVVVGVRKTPPTDSVEHRPGVETKSLNNGRVANVVYRIRTGLEAWATFNYRTYHHSAHGYDGTRGPAETLREIAGLRLAM